MKGFAYGVGLLAALSMPAAEAVNQEIRALFQPDPSQPNRNVFINKTPNSGYCANYPSECADNNMFSIHVPVRFDSTRALMPGDGLGLKVPANWRQLTVTNRDTQETETVEVRIIGIGSNFFLSDTAANLVGVSNILEGHQKLWTSSSWVYAPSPCQYSGVGAYTPATYKFFWKAPVEAPCIKVAAYRIPSMYFNGIDFAYELRTPNPLGMSSGLYGGSLSYHLGPGGDFQMGTMMVPDDNNLTLDFVLDVQHTLKVDLPPGGNKVFLEPEGGWRQWIDSGRKPTRIYRDQPFYISASSRFKVMMECAESFTSTECNLRNASALRTAVEVNMSLPPGITGPGGAGVKDVKLRHKQWVGPFQPGHYVDRKQGNLRFEMAKHRIDALLKPGVSDTYSGYVTVIWDSEV
ncbi:hypothetical protein [Pseudomonas sp. G(2018)]|uniref:hypothetical protein n=1 Tax=Pseudomonas sp. G(2018) TaxID=2502242 RepID=UPI0010FA102B|nr:hypothetical protein [Pseudomonas sp. G(2018)]